MKEQDLNKHLDNIIIKGLIREAQQDNADFEAAMRNISEEDFDKIIGSHANKEENREVFAESNVLCSKLPPEPFFDNDFDFDNDGKPEQQESEKNVTSPLPKKPKNVKRKLLMPWLVSTVAAVAVILIVLIPTISYMNNMEGKLCDSALYASEYFISPARGGFDVATASVEELEKELPALEDGFSKLTPDAENVNDYEEAGWNLAVAYLRLHKKSEAVAVLKKLAYGNYPHGDTGISEHCAELLKYLQ